MDILDIDKEGRRGFELIRCIGKGGFGEVYLAKMSTSTGFSKTVAVKLLRLDVEDTVGVAARLRDEARMLGMLRHRSIVQADDLITLDGRPAVVMEYIPGYNLSWIVNPRHFPARVHPRPALAIIRQVASALDAAYSRPSAITGAPLEVLHRDIKPANIRVTPDGEVKVLDFGIARSTQMDREAETRNYQMGSLRYMAPELMDDKPASPASDIYALGVVGFELLSRMRLGWAGESTDAHEAQLRKRLDKADLNATGDAREGIEALLLGMLAFEGDDRLTALDVVKRCRALVREIPGPSLEEWVQERAALIRIPDDPENAPLLGRTLYEEQTGPYKPGQPLPEAELEFEDLTVAEEQPPQTEGPPKEASRQGRRVPYAYLAILFLLFLAVVAVFLLNRAEMDALQAELRARTVGRSAETTRPSDEAPTPPEAPPAQESPEEEPQPPTEQEPAASPAEPSAREARRTPEPKPAALQPITVRFASVPLGIRILVDDEPQGRTPATKALAPGRHRLVFVDGDKHLEQQIDVRENGRSLWTYKRSLGKVE